MPPGIIGVEGVPTKTKENVEKLDKLFQHFSHELFSFSNNSIQHNAFSHICKQQSIYILSHSIFAMLLFTEAGKQKFLSSGTTVTHD